METVSGGSLFTSGSAGGKGQRSLLNMDRGCAGLPSVMTAVNEEIAELTHSFKSYRAQRHVKAFLFWKECCLQSLLYLCGNISTWLLFLCFFLFFFFFILQEWEHCTSINRKHQKRKPELIFLRWTFILQQTHWKNLTQIRFCITFHYSIMKKCSVHVTVHLSLQLNGRNEWSNLKKKELHAVSSSIAYTVLYDL